MASDNQNQKLPLTRQSNSNIQKMKIVQSEWESNEIEIDELQCAQRREPEPHCHYRGSEQHYAYGEPGQSNDNGLYEWEDFVEFSSDTSSNGANRSS